MRCPWPDARGAACACPRAGQWRSFPQRRRARRHHSTQAMNITKDTAVTLTYRVTDPATGKPLDAGHVAYLHGGYENIFPKVEAALEGQAVGHAATLEIGRAHV